MGKRKKSQGECAYCGGKAEAIEHVIARQFYFGEAPQKHNIPRVPTCNNCNQQKQRSEDLAGVLLTLMSGEDTALDVANNRISRTLNQNKKILKLLETVKMKIRIGDTGKFEKVGLLEIPQDSQDLLREFYLYLVKGMYKFETGTRVPQKHSIALFYLTGNSYAKGLIDHVTSKIRLTVKEYALGEFKVAYAVEKEDTPDKISSVWFVEFRNTSIYAVTHGIEDEQVLMNIDKWRWK
ncbi:HNH endonuclease [Deinococcus sp.]|uniref:HNH endonuclease n=1 Tax=Deinococcus sp. TaxID=47478 RepID=UPI003B5C3038